MNKFSTSGNRPNQNPPRRAPAAIANPHAEQIALEDLAWAEPFSDWLDGELLALETDFAEYVTPNSFRPTCR